jgi:hypothetical protein
MLYFLRSLQRLAAYLLVIAAASLVAAAPVRSQASIPVSVLTQHNDTNRSGDDPSETILTPQTVVPGSFGKLWELSVKGKIYAQPLYVANQPINSGQHDVLYVATALNNVYAYNADAKGKLYWSDNLGTPVPSSDYNTTHPYLPVSPYIGILSTPVIDPSINTIFCVANTTDGTNHHFFLHALDLTTGAEQAGSPVEITGSVPGVGVGSSGGVLPFNPFYELQRPALLLSNGVIYIAFGGHQELPIEHGWLFAYSESNLSQIASFCSTPNGADGLGSFWASGQAPTVDGNGYVYIATGNGATDASSGGSDYAMSVLKMQLSGNTLAPVDYFTPWDVTQENNQDKDIGVIGPLLIPGTNSLLQGGKDGHFYLLDTGNLGGFQKKNNNQILQDFQATQNEIHGSPVIWQSGASTYFYVWSQNDYLKQYQFVDGSFNTTPLAESPMEDPIQTPGGTLSISSNGSTPGTGILWALLPWDQSGYNNPMVGVLRAFPADNVGTELWDSEMNPTHDKLGYYAKFVEPTIANGKVFVATFSGAVVVYGLLPPTNAATKTTQAK